MRAIYQRNTPRCLKRGGGRQIAGCGGGRANIGHGQTGVFRCAEQTGGLPHEQPAGVAQVVDEMARVLERVFVDVPTACRDEGIQGLGPVHIKHIGQRRCDLMFAYRALGRDFI